MITYYYTGLASTKFPPLEGSRIRSIGPNEIKFELQIIQMMRFTVIKYKFKKLVQNPPKACVESWFGGKSGMDVALGATNINITISGIKIAQYATYRGILY